jgi:hemoglobin/transferrin/lactoferrin receptor protein
MRVVRQLALVSVCFVTGISAAWADNAVPLQLADTETVTVTGTRNPTSAETYPGMVDVRDYSDIQADIPSTVSDIFYGMPNVQFDGGPRRTGESPSIRGLGGQDVLTLVDGVRQSWTSGHDGQFFLDPSLLAGVDVVRGPNSALYGSGALGGVIAFRTLNASDLLGPDQTTGLRVGLGYQGVDDEFLRMVTGFTHIGDLDVIGSIGQRTSGDIKLGSGATLPASDNVVTGFAKVGYDFGDGLSVKVSYEGYRDHANEPDDGSDDSIVSSEDPLKKKSITSQQFSGEIDWKPTGTNLVDLHLTPYHIDGKVGELDPLTGDYAVQEIKTDGFSADNRTPFTFANISGLFTFGGEWYQDKQSGMDDQGVGGVRSGVPDGKDDFWGAFAQIEANVDHPLGAPGKLTIIPAVRYDSFKSSSTGNPDLSKDSTSPKIAATYAPTDWFFLFGNTGKAFRAPGINELYLEGTHFEVPHPILPGVSVANNFEPNPDLKPETSKYWEAGAGVAFTGILSSDDSFHAKASYWHQNVDDYIDLSVFTPPTFYSLGCFTPPTFQVDCNVGYTTSVNVNAELHGTEVEATYDAPRWALQADYGTIDGKERGTPYALNSLMPNILSVIATLKLPEVDGSLNARMQNAGAFHKTLDPISNDPPSDDRKGYTTLDLYATWAPANDILSGKLHGLRIDAGVDNVTNENYAPYAQGVSAAGRNFKVLSSYTFTW